MPKTATLPPTDPLSRFTDGARITGGAPLPLSGQRISVRVGGGLATVTTERRFCNAEAQSIEATLTFPVPVHATLLQLQARIGTRSLVATAQPRAEARETYEAAIDEGKTAVLHEEALRGVHMLSVGHIPPGAEIAVTDCWAMPLAAEGAALGLRIPTTVGEIYGRSPLSESDDLVTGAVVHEAEFEIVTDSGIVRLLDGELRDGRARLRLDRPIRIEIAGALLRPLHGVAADGRAVTLSLTPAPAGDAALDAELLIDRSGSMASAVTATPGAPSKFAVVQEALRRVAGTLRPEDRLGLWQFANVPQKNHSRRGGFAEAVEQLAGPSGGTELGSALAAAAAEEASDVVLVTDGMSHALDVQALARTGRRFTVVLIGADALEANVGHLAALSGGQLFAVADAEAGQALLQALASLRTPHRRPEPIEGAVVQAGQRIGGLQVTAEWHAAPPGKADRDARAIGAVAAALALPRLDRAAATALAAAEGIVCHLTSLVLVDQAGEAQEGLPAQRKIPLMAPAVASAPPMLMRQRSAAPAGMPNAIAVPAPAAGSGAPAQDQSKMASPGFLAKVAAPFLDALGAVIGSGTPREPVAPIPADVAPVPPQIRIPPIDPGRIDWSQDPEALRRGDASGLAADILLVLTEAAGHAEIQALANRLGVRPMAVAIALLAALEADSDRNAARIFRAVLGAEPPETIAALRRALGW
jgi:Vault protein inter-alpha-trypsin domain/von Willebrand factor type A domain